MKKKTEMKKILDYADKQRKKLGYTVRERGIFGAAFISGFNYGRGWHYHAGFVDGVTGKKKAESFLRGLK